MSRAYSDIAFTPAVRALQTRMGSRSGYASLDHTTERRDTLTQPEIAFIQAREGFYQATVSETGWPYVQFRGGPTGFLKVLDNRTIGYADFRGNVQYISVGNLLGNDRVSMILMDYANQRRLKILGRVRMVSQSDEPELITRLESDNYPARVERAIIISIEAYDWNCPQHITPRFTDSEIGELVAPLEAEIARLKRELNLSSARAVPRDLGHGPLALRINGIRQLTETTRAYELCATEGINLPLVRAGSHIDMPVQLESGLVSTRRYSIGPHPSRRNTYEIAVLREDSGTGGSVAVHGGYQIGMVLRCGLPGNDFAMHEDDRPAVLIAGGIGITPIRAMAKELSASGRPFEVHYAVRTRSDAAYLDELEGELGASLHVYSAQEGRRLDVARLVAGADAEAVFYVCGPTRLIDAVRESAAKAGLHEDRVRFERFTRNSPMSTDKPIDVVLSRSGKRITVPATLSILDAVEAIGIGAPSGCRSGTCGSCRVKVLSGQPEHRDTALSDVERVQAGLMCICVSRSKGASLTLDL